MYRMLFVLVLIGLCVHTASALPGSGTQQDPWRIESLANFDEFAADPNYWAGFTRLETDVNLAGRTYSTAVIAPDVNNSSGGFDGTAFTGVFDGNDHKIIGLTIDDGGVGNDFLGLFGCINGGEVKNLRLEGGSVRGDYFVGGLVGENGEDRQATPGHIINSYFTGDVSGGDCVGGLVGHNEGSVTQCYSSGAVKGDLLVGGLVGNNSISLIMGLGGGPITDSFSTSTVTATSVAGGLVGYNWGRIWHCYSTGSVSGGDVGGLVGVNGGNISNCYSTGPVVSDSSYVGGLVAENDGIVSNCYSISDVNGIGYVGGLVGRNCLIVCPDRCYISPGYIFNSYSTGNVSGNEIVGGLVGDNAGSVSNCYSISDVNGVGYVGGLVGTNGYRYRDLEPGYIYNCYSTGSVEGGSSVGGLIGYNECGDIERSFWDVQTSGEPNMCGYQDEEYATGCDPNCGKTTAEMKTRSTFTDAGWDFVEIWLINNGATYPVLRQEIRSDLNGNGGVDFVDFAIFADHWLEGIAP